MSEDVGRLDYEQACEQIRLFLSDLSNAPHAEHFGPFCPVCGLIWRLRTTLDAPAHPQPPMRERILAQLSAERDRQDEKWGGIPGIDRRDDHTYAAVLGEEYGEVCKAWLQREVDALREELIQTAAVAVAWVEEIDNGGAIPRPLIVASVPPDSGTPTRPDDVVDGSPKTAGVAAGDTTRSSGSVAVPQKGKQ